MTRALSLSRINRNDVRRGILAGSAWGLTLAAGLQAMDFANCGVICIDNAILTVAICIVTGILAIGPVAALGSHVR